MVHCSKENRLNISQISKLAKNTPKNDKRTKQTRIPSFWGDVGVKKWSLFSDLAAQSPIFGHLKTNTYSKSAQFWVPKMGLWAPESKNGDHFFHANIPPNRWNRHLFYVFITFVWILSQFWSFAHFGQFLARFT